MKILFPPNHPQIMERIPKYPKQHKVLRKAGMVLAEQAYFSQSTSTNFAIRTPELLQLSEEKFVRSLVRVTDL